MAARAEKRVQLPLVVEKRLAKPLVYASSEAVEQARPLLPSWSSCLEVEVGYVILAGRVEGGNTTGRVIGDGWTAHVKRVPGRLRPKPRAWLVLRVEATR